MEAKKAESGYAAKVKEDKDDQKAKRASTKGKKEKGGFKQLAVYR